jgi:hypothetical protein
MNPSCGLRTPCRGAELQRHALAGAGSDTDAIRFYERFGASFDNGWLNGTLEREQMQALLRRP